MLDPNPKTRITMAMIKEDEWFKEGYTPANPEDEEEGVYIDDEAFSIHNVILCNFHLSTVNNSYLT